MPVSNTIDFANDVSNIALAQKHMEDYAPPRRRNCQALHSHQDPALSLLHNELALSLELCCSGLKL